MGSVATSGSREKSGPAAAPDGPLIPIGALAQRTRCNVETIRFYEKIGVLPKPQRTEGGHRAYARTHVARLSFIRRARELGFPLDEVRALLRLADVRTVACNEVKAVAITHLADVRAKIAALQAMQDSLVALIAGCDTDDRGGCPLVETLLDNAATDHPRGPGTRTAR